ncbi:hypothetical protein PP175_25800 (plasmid) [Aneurinibacillus sp. Ricciae_BoGa-3]|uniref:hypothetical protein n=1 Tax=Aneurinibacillus sp. Ricciae_BoGa-3 TaxID=3022697 RepID=UPI002340B171|nr:hypothetical protein [Aneurinibacillus sp. Ricciae_BoGa-3]WCK57483.1 hypothetical protein PP175_25800 [Aneurinibacillus sp. Ricciae_BoGa-3]
MEKIRLIRYADEGFTNYEQRHIHAFGGMIQGCYAFIDKEQESLLSYTDAYRKENPSVVNRLSQTRHELLLSGDTMVYVKNKKLVGPQDRYLFQSRKGFCGNSRRTD